MKALGVFCAVVIVALALFSGLRIPETPIECAVLPVNCPPCEGLGVRLYGSAMVDGVLCWYHPETDLLVPASRWEEFIEKLREEPYNEPEQPS